MDRIRDNYVAEIQRLEGAIRETRSGYLRRDYSKAVRRMRKELRDYDRFRSGKVGAGV